jgi:hypothetical protein
MTVKIGRPRHPTILASVSLALQVPTLTPFEALVALGETDPWWAPGTRLGPGPRSESCATAARTAMRDDTSLAVRSRAAAPQRLHEARNDAAPVAAEGLDDPDLDHKTARSSSQSGARSSAAAPEASCAAEASRPGLSGAKAPPADAERRQRDVAQQTACSDGGFDLYPMDYYARDGGVWGSSYHRKPAGRNTALPTPTASVVS